MYRPPFAFIYALVSRTAAFIYGAAANPSCVFTPYRVSYYDARENLIGDEESCHVVVFVECVNDFRKCCIGICWPGRRCLIDHCIECIDIQK
jgi:hypothetical protein